MLYPPINLIAEWLWHDVHSPWSHDRLFLIATGVCSSLKPLESKGIIEMFQHTWLIQNIADSELCSQLLAPWSSVSLYNSLEKLITNHQLSWYTILRQGIKMRLCPLGISSVAKYHQGEFVNKFSVTTLKLPFPAMS